VVTLAEWLAQGPFDLAMSSGFFSFYAHTGTLGALLARGLVPARVGGSSAGAMVTGLWAAGMSTDDLARTLMRLRRVDFWDPAPGAGLLRGQLFDRVLRSIAPVSRIEDCRVPVRISVFDILARKTTVISRGDLADAIRASCCVPGMFQPVRIDGRSYWDGGVLDRPGIHNWPAGRLLFHHIAAPAPWSKTEPPVPVRENMTTLVLRDLPRPNPFRLDAGRAALVAAREATDRALDARIVDGVVRIHV
jgi:NTE family protein